MLLVEKQKIRSMKVGISKIPEVRGMGCYMAEEQKSNGDIETLPDIWSPITFMVGMIGDYIGDKEEVVLYSNWDSEIDKRGVSESELEKLRKALNLQGIAARVI